MISELVLKIKTVGSSVFCEAYETEESVSVISNCHLNIEDGTWTISGWYTVPGMSNKGIGKKILKSTFEYCLKEFGLPGKVLYTWNGKNKYVMDWLSSNFDARCTCSIEVLKNLGGKDIWDCHIYELNKEKLFEYFGL